jgi:hypothetical protein
MIALLCSCSKASTTEPVSSDSVAVEVERMLHKYHEAMKTGGLLAEFNFLDNSPDFFWVPPGYESTLTYDSVRTILEKNARAIASIQLEWETLRIFPLSNRIANYSGIVRSVSTDTSGAVHSVRMIESGTTIKREDGWKLLNGQSAILPSN